MPDDLDLDSAPPPLSPPPAGLDVEDDDDDDDDATVSEGEDDGGSTAGNSGSGGESEEESSSSDDTGTGGPGSDSEWEEGEGEGEEEGGGEERDSEGDGVSHGEGDADCGDHGPARSAARGGNASRSPPPSPSAAASGDDGADDPSAAGEGGRRRRGDGTADRDGDGGDADAAAPAAPPPPTAEPADDEAARSEAAHALRAGRSLLRDREVTVHTFLFNGSLGASIDQNRGGGCTVSEVTPGGRADGLGVAPGDILFSAATSGGREGGGGASSDTVGDDDGDEGPRRKRRRRDDDGPGPSGHPDGNANGVSDGGSSKAQTRPGKFQPKAIRFDGFLSLVASNRNRPLRITVIRVSESPAERTARLLREAEEAKAEADTAKAKSEADIVSARDAIEEARLALERARERYDEAVETDKSNAERAEEAMRHLEEEWALQKRPEWDMMYGRLCRFKEEHGHTWVKKPVEKRWTQPRIDEAGGGDGPNRGRIVEERFRAWVDAQRRQYRIYLEMSPEERASPCSSSRSTQRLTSEMARKLEDIGFVSSWREQLDGPEWWDTYRKLSEFRLRHGHVDINKGSRSDDVVNQLFQWSTVQRQRHGGGNLSTDKVEALERVGFRFEEEEDGHHASWDSMFERLRRFHEVNGHTDVPTTREDEKHLATWAMKQRRLQRSVRDKLTPERYAALQSLGFVWNINEAKWQQRYRELLDYKDTFGDCNVKGVPGPHFDLGMWAQRMRNYYTHFQDGEHHSTLTLEKIQKLEAVGFKWLMRAHRPREATMKSEEQIWNERYGELKAFYEKYGHCRILSKKIAASASSNRLKSWIALQRRQYKEFQEGQPTAMNTERIRLLEELRFDFNPIKGRKYYD